MNQLDNFQIEKKIYYLRGLKVMLDSDLALLYGVETKALNQAVRRNLERFPDDFMFECNIKELEDLRSQFVTANLATDWNHKRRNLPMCFTENGIAMLSSVLNSSEAISVNISIMRIFTKLRSFLLLEERMNSRMDHLEKGATKMFKIVFERLDSLEEKEEITPKRDERRKIGIRNSST